MTGRALALLAGLGADLQPAGWRLTGAPRASTSAAPAFPLGQDLDASRSRPRAWPGLEDPGHRALDPGRDRGAPARRPRPRRPRGAARAGPGPGRGPGRPRRRRPPPAAGVDRLVVQVDEPALPASLGGRCPPPPASTVTAASTCPRPPRPSRPCSTPSSRPAASPGCTPAPRVRPWTCCAAPAPAAWSSTSTSWPPRTTTVGEALEAGESVVLGVLPSTDPADPALGQGRHRPGRAVAGDARPGPRGGRRPARRLPVLRPGRGDPGWATRAVRLSATVARNL